MYQKLLGKSVCTVAPAPHIVVRFGYEIFVSEVDEMPQIEGRMLIQTWSWGISWMKRFIYELLVTSKLLKIHLLGSRLSSRLSQRLLLLVLIGVTTSHCHCMIINLSQYIKFSFRNSMLILQIWILRIDWVKSINWMTLRKSSEWILRKADIWQFLTALGDE